MGLSGWYAILNLPFLFAGAIVSALLSLNLLGYMVVCFIATTASYWVAGKLADRNNPSRYDKDDPRNRR
jgi:hypothetical protein